MKKKIKIPKISIVILTHNNEKYIHESINSILNQSFFEYECFIVDSGSTDKTCDIVRSYTDKRIKLFENKQDNADSLNLCLKTAQGKYIANMHANDIMHPDRLKIQYAIMETETTIAICGTWMRCIGEKIHSDTIANTLNGLVENPLLSFLRGNFLFYPTTIVRKKILKQYKLRYDEKYPYAEDFKLWTEIAKRKGRIYIDNQPLLLHRIPDDQKTSIKEEQQHSNNLIINELLHHLILKNKLEYPELKMALSGLKKLQQKGLVTNSDISLFFQSIFSINKTKFITI